MSLSLCIFMRLQTTLTHEAMVGSSPRHSGATFPSLGAQECKRARSLPAKALIGQSSNKAGPPRHTWGGQSAPSPGPGSLLLDAHHAHRFEPRGRPQLRKHPWERKHHGGKWLQAAISPWPKSPPLQNGQASGQPSCGGTGAGSVGCHASIPATCTWASGTGETGSRGGSEERSARTRERRRGPFELTQPLTCHFSRVRHILNISREQHVALLDKAESDA